MADRLSFSSKCSILLGNLFEHYDTALFSLLSPFIASLFFPGKDPLTALILTYCIIPLGMVARPLGSLFFGYIGDKYGRQEALIVALTGMALVTFCMGLMPTYQQVGFLAPILLSAGRLLQNFFAAGEIIGGAIYLIEHTSEKRKDMMSSFYNASTVIGILLASLAVSTLGIFNLIQDHWRMLYFAGCLTALFAILLRLKMKLNPSFSASPSALNPVQSVMMTCWKNRKTLLVIMIASGFSYASYTMALVMMNGLVPLVTSISKLQMMHLNTLLLSLDFLLLPFFGFLATRYSREKMMISAGLMAFITALPLFCFIQEASLFTIMLIRLSIIIIGVGFSAPFHSWSQTLVQPSERYTVISFGYALGTQLLGGPTAALSLWLFQSTGFVTSAAWYWMILGCLASYFIAKQKFALAPQANKLI